ncbi:hypothetical protein BST36_20800 [Mycolicibacterium moriokaense]|uniref:Uncharacterized protein n=1 Tax=Mycolicibacterium moriokaense TaxID=39691 RepID=A0AAD1HCE2_9MYCO|nr:hypothetical protein [Mycolicibacterium moriokaense]MCV7039687.1 hypothetical protein [Mycolicibacterium moriokaense]ORB19866.1 hypothetical protein BST36_20800 [Mycolicibacterium moriokaense]BBX01866.1 hypothetical protein MMOR_28020 [Mycolicibacterium moriokaense]
MSIKINSDQGAPTYVALRRDNGVTIHQGKSHIMLAPDELSAVLDAIYTITGQSDPRGSEKTTTNGNN